MVLTRNNVNYTLLHETENYKLEGAVYIEDQEVNVNVKAYLTDGSYIAACSYKYRDGGYCSKAIGDCNHQYIQPLEGLLEEIIDFLIEEFKLS